MSTYRKTYRGQMSAGSESTESGEEKVGALDDNSGRDVANSIADGYAKARQGQGGQEGSAADTAGSAMMMSGNPYAMAAGAALKVVSGISKKKAAERKAKADAENTRRSKLISALGQLGSGVGSTGMA